MISHINLLLFLTDPLPGRLGKVEFLCYLFSSDGPKHLPDQPLDFSRSFEIPSSSILTSQSAS